MGTICNPFERAGDVLEALRPIAVRHLPDADARLARLHARLEEQRIQVILFGAYNAGKSTLINAMLGEGVAQVGDVPTTDRVERHDWCGHVLLDTPGVNAPIAHERISAEQLRGADLVLFVVRDGDQDVQDLFDRLFALLEAGRHLFVLLNHQAGSPEAAEQLRARLNQVLLHQTGLRGMADRLLNSIPVVLLDADLAMKGRLSDKAVLRECSGYDDFADRFNCWLAEFDEAQRRLELLVQSIERQLLDPLGEALERGSAGGSGLERIEAEIAHVERLRSNFERRANSWVRAKLVAVRPRIGALLDSASTGEVLQAGLQQLTVDLGQELSAWLEAECGAEPAKAAGVDDVHLDAAAYEGSNEPDGGARMRETVLKGVRAVGRDEISKALHLGRRLKLPWLKGRWSSTLDKWAGRASPVLQLLVSALEVGAAVRDERERNRQLREAALQRHQWIEEVATNLESSLLKAVAAAIDEAFRGQCEPLRAKRAEHLRDADAQARDRALLGQHAATLSALACAASSSPLDARAGDHCSGANPLNLAT